MKLLVVFALLAVGSVSLLPGQSLDIGGLEIRVGQPTSDVIARLRSAYTVNFDEGLKLWFVTKTPDGSGPIVWVGNFAATNGIVSSISKGYALPDFQELAAVYTQAIIDVHLRGGTTCVTQPVASADGVVRRIQSACGRYVLNLLLPWKQNNGDTIGAGVSIDVGGRP